MSIKRADGSPVDDRGPFEAGWALVGYCDGKPMCCLWEDDRPLLMDAATILDELAEADEHDFDLDWCAEFVTTQAQYNTLVELNGGTVDAL